MPRRSVCAVINIEPSTYAELSQDTNRVAARVLDESAWDNLHSIRDGPEWPALNALDTASLRVQADANRHLCRTTSRSENRIENYISRNGHGIGKISVDLVENILGWATEENSAGFWCVTLSQESEVPITSRS